MPYLMLDFEAAKDPATKKDMIKFTMIDTDKGEVLELEAELLNIKQELRQPRLSELQNATKMLNKDVDRRISREAFESVKLDKENFEKEKNSLRVALEEDRKRIEQLADEVASLRKSQLDASAKSIIGDALDNHIEALALTEHLESYELAKKIYKDMTGKPWVEEDDDDDMITAQQATERSQT